MRPFIFNMLLFISLCSASQNIDYAQLPGVAINHVSAAKNLYIGSPSICILLNGNYVATHEFFGSGNKDKSSVVQVFLSTDKGKTWQQISKIEGQVWSKLFVLHNDLYILGPVSNGGDLVIRKSNDGGHHWTTPIDRFSGRLFDGHFHSSSTAVLFYNGRVWKAVEDVDGPYKGWGKEFRAMVVSAPIDADILKAANWTKTNAMPYNPEYLNGDFGGWLEGNIVLGPNDKLVNMLRADYREADGEKAALISISNDGKTASFDPENGFINFPGGCKKFNILYDNESQLYWTISNYVPEQEKGYNPERTRNTQALMCSGDLRNWNVKGIVLHHPDVEKHGFQYVDFQFEGKDIIFVSRTAYDDDEGGADSQHNANYLTFHRIKNFRDYVTPVYWQELMP